MAKYDLENFRDYFLGLLQSGMAAKVAEINAEKNDAYLIETIPSAQYFNDTNAKILNYNKYIFYGFTDIKTIANPRGDYALEATMAFDVVFTEPEGGLISENLILRYTRAMAEIITENAVKNGNISDIEIELFAPTSVLDNQTSARIKIGGVSVKGTIG